MDNIDVVLFCRVSTMIQDYERQVNDLTKVCHNRNWYIKSTFTEKISGVKKNDERKELTKMIQFLKENNIKKVLVTELSRLGRDTLQVLQVIETLNSIGVSLFIQNYNIETLNDNGEVNSMSQFLVTLLSEIARMERKTIRERMKSGYINYVDNGGRVGRKLGYLKSDQDMINDYEKEIKLMKKGLSLRLVSRISGRSVNTLRKLQVYV